MIKQIAHICILAKDLEETSKFYTEVLGLEKSFEFEQKDGKIRGYYIKIGNNTFFEIYQGTPGEVGNIHHVSIEVDDLQSLIEKVRSHGIDIADKTYGGDNAWQTWLTDPNGVKLELHEYTPESSQITANKVFDK